MWIAWTLPSTLGWMWIAISLPFHNFMEDKGKTFQRNASSACPTYTSPRTPAALPDYFGLLLLHWASFQSVSTSNMLILRKKRCLQREVGSLQQWEVRVTSASDDSCVGSQSSATHFSLATLQFVSVVSTLQWNQERYQELHVRDNMTVFLYNSQMEMLSLWQYQEKAAYVHIAHALVIGVVLAETRRCRIVVQVCQKLQARRQSQASQENLLSQICICILMRPKESRLLARPAAYLRPWWWCGSPSHPQHKWLFWAVWSHASSDTALSPGWAEPSGHWLAHRRASGPQLSALSRVEQYWTLNLITSLKCSLNGSPEGNSILYPIGRKKQWCLDIVTISISLNHSPKWWLFDLWKSCLQGFMWIRIIKSISATVKRK